MAGEDVVKSVGRVFAVLELFDTMKAPLTATEVERALVYPQSSTLALLKSMVALGYLSFDRNDRRYLPTIRTAMLGQWVDEVVEGQVRLQELVAEISDAVGETVSLCCQSDLEFQFLMVSAGSNPLTLNIRAGDTGPLFHSIVGRVALSQKKEGDLRKLAARANRQRKSPYPPVDVDEVLAEMKTIRKAGYGVGYGRYIDAIGAIAWPLPPRPRARPLVLSIAGPVADIRSQERQIVKTVNRILAAHHADQAAHQGIG